MTMSIPEVRQAPVAAAVVTVILSLSVVSCASPDKPSVDVSAGT